jgi:alcohol dehydrogenase class IV
MSAVSVRHVTPAFRTYAGARSLEALGKELARTGAERVVVFCGASMVRQGDVLAQVEDSMDGRVAGRFSGVQENSPVPAVEEAAAVLRDVGADAAVALGGGSAIVTARAASILAAENRPVRDLSTRREDGKLVSPRLAAPKIAQWIVPTTPTTAYAKAGAAVRDLATGERLALFDPKARAAGVFLHPAAAATAPPHLVQASALNAFAMCVDGLQSSTDDPFAEAQMRQALRMIREWLPRLDDGDGVVDGDVGVRLMLAALLAGQASDHVGTGLAQPISHALGPHATVGNGVVEAIMLPHVMRYNEGHTDAGQAAVAETLNPGGPTGPASARAAVVEFLRTIGVPDGLAAAGVGRQELPAAIDHILDDWAVTTVPRPADGVALHDLLHAAL